MVQGTQFPVNSIYFQPWEVKTSHGFLLNITTYF